MNDGDKKIMNYQEAIPYGDSFAHSGQVLSENLNSEDESELSLGRSLQNCKSMAVSKKRLGTANKPSSNKPSLTVSPSN